MLIILYKKERVTISGYCKADCADFGCQAVDVLNPET
jgi:hypothetical protein